MSAAAPTVIDHPSPNYGARRDAPIDLLVLHYTDLPTLDEALAILTDPARAVSAHYLIAADGRIFQLVAEGQRAWHAGVAYWGGVTDVNSRSIGIELDNPGHGHGPAPFPPAQMASLIALAGNLTRRHPIPPAGVIGHSDVAPARKQDPGALFDWAALAAAGLGLWPSAARPRPLTVAEAESHLTTIGYDPDRRRTCFADALGAFQRHWRPARVDGVLDDETGGLLAAVTAAASV